MAKAITKKTTQTKINNEEIKKETKVVEPQKVENSNDAIMAMLKQLQARLDKQDEEIKQKDKLIQEQAEAMNNLEKISKAKETSNTYKTEARVFDKKASSDIKIGNEEDIVVVNLFDGEFSLSTEGFGNGKIYTFNNFGDELEIPYEDLKEIIHNNKSFIESGRVYICDERVIIKHKLQNFYQNMLTCEDIQNLINMDAKDFFDTLIKLPKASSSTLNKDNEPDQIDMVYHYIIESSKKEEFPYELIAQLERAYEIKKGVRINIHESLESYHNIFDKKES